MYISVNKNILNSLSFKYLTKLQFNMINLKIGEIYENTFFYQCFVVIFSAKSMALGTPTFS